MDGRLYFAIEMYRKKQQSAIAHVLKALIPYSNENLMLTYKPNKFFNELEKISSYNQSTLKNAYWRGKQRGLISENDSKIPYLTDKGLEQVKPFVPQKLGKDAKLMVIFDVPESDRRSRNIFRNMLKTWGFKQIQKSVWMTDNDYRKIIKGTVRELRLEECVEVYESLKV